MIGKRLPGRTDRSVAVPPGGNSLIRFGSVLGPVLEPILGRFGGPPHGLAPFGPRLGSRLKTTGSKSVFDKSYVFPWTDGEEWLRPAWGSARRARARTHTSSNISRGPFGTGLKPSHSNESVSFASGHKSTFGHKTHFAQTAKSMSFPSLEINSPGWPSCFLCPVGRVVKDSLRGPGTDANNGNGYQNVCRADLVWRVCRRRK